MNNLNVKNVSIVKTKGSKDQILFTLISDTLENIDELDLTILVTEGFGETLCNSLGINEFDVVNTR